MGSHTSEALLALLLYVLGTFAILFTLWGLFTFVMDIRASIKGKCVICQKRDVMRNQVFCQECFDKYVEENEHGS